MDQEELLKLGRECVDQFREKMESEFPSGNTSDISAVASVVVTTLMTSSFVSLAEGQGPRMAEAWLTATLADFAESTEKSLTELGYTSKIQIQTVSRVTPQEET